MIARHETYAQPHDVWSKLAAPVPQTAIAWRQDGKPITRDGRHYARFVCYIDASTVRERLDTVVPGEWDLTLELLPALPGGDDNDAPYAFKARLQVCGVIREDVGMGRDYKSASTDAFKRAAVRFGIGHELYAYEQNWVELDGDGKYAKPLEDPQHAYERRHGASAQRMPSRKSGAVELEHNAGSLLTDVDQVSCPKCGGRMWDNRLTKRNPKAPDYKCRNRSCDGVIWPAKTEGKAESAADGSAEEAAQQSPVAAGHSAADDDIPF
jgi:hypothetical protein